MKSWVTYANRDTDTLHLVVVLLRLEVAVWLLLASMVGEALVGVAVALVVVATAVRLIVTVAVDLVVSLEVLTTVEHAEVVGVALRRR